MTTAFIQAAFCLCYCIGRQSQRTRRIALRFSSADSLRTIGETPGETASILLLIITAHRTKRSVSIVASAKLRLGGEHGQTVEVRSGDVILIPAGVAHQNIGDSSDFSVVGAYPDGRQWDLLRGLPGERPKSDHTIAALPIPDYDPIYGVDGPLRQIWKCAERQRRKFNMPGTTSQDPSPPKNPSAKGAFHLSGELHPCAPLKRAYSACCGLFQIPGAMPQASYEQRLWRFNYRSVRHRALFRRQRNI